MNSIKNVIIALSLLALTNLAYAEVAITADIKSVRVVDTGVILKIDHGGNCSGCTAGGHFIPFSADNADAAKGKLSVALSAKATRKPITIYTDWTSTCVAGECLAIVNSVELE